MGRKLSVRQTPNTLKCTVVGDSGVGKTCLLVTYVTKTFPATSAPASFAWHLAGTNYSRGSYPRVRIGDVNYTLDFTDTLGLDCDRSRPMSYLGTDVFIICFDISNPRSLRHARSKWLREIQGTSPSTPFILVGLKLDTRPDPPGLDEDGGSPGVVSGGCRHEDGVAAARDMGAREYVECSALTQDGVTSVFVTAAHAAHVRLREQKKDDRRAGCVVS